MEDKSDLTNNTIIDPTEKQEKKIENKSPEPKKIVNNPSEGIWNTKSVNQPSENIIMHPKID